MVFGKRIPCTYFEVSGFGETDEGAGTAPFETGAHDLAMEDAGIHMFNLMTYTSMLPAEAKKKSLEEAAESFHHGAVLECIMAETFGSRGDRITAGVGTTMIRKKGEVDENAPAVGGFAVEYKGHASYELAEKELRDALEELFDRRFGKEDHEMEPPSFRIATHTVSKSFASAMAGVCFTDYIFPVVQRDSS